MQMSSFSKQALEVLQSSTKNSFALLNFIGIDHLSIGIKTLLKAVVTRPLDSISFKSKFFLQNLVQKHIRTKKNTFTTIFVVERN